jgi:hypothetical protein
MLRKASLAMSILLCLQLLTPLIPDTASASAYTKDAGPVTMEIGQPSVWSMAQAHYFLTRMQQTNRSLDTRMPTIDQLDPNKANASRLEILRTLLQVDAGFDQSVGLKNRIELDKFRDKEERKAQAAILLQQRQASLQQIDQELLDLKQQLAMLTVQDQLADKARGDAPPSAADRKRKEQIASLTVLSEAKLSQKTALQTEITTLTTTATTDVDTPSITAGSAASSGSNLDTTPPTGTKPPGSSGSTALTDFVTKAVESASSSPSLAASVALDNFVGMQYEIIAKQLTLLRDEAGADERIMFLEIPTSIYTVDGWANDLIAQVQWRITGVYNKPPTLGIACKGLKSEGQSSSAIYQALQLDKYLQRPHEDGSNSDDLDETRCLLDVIPKKEAENKNIDALANTEIDIKSPITTAMLHNMKPLELKSLQWQPVRTLEIIPRQSALNINEFQATTNYTGVLGFLRLLSGFGAQINFQRQREVYQALLQQQVYASGFGKGTPNFGWTFGPLPGSRRIAPGQRTTYAVLAVPKDTLAIRLEADGLAFPRKARPSQEDRVAHRTFLVSIPGERTTGFWVDSIDYTTVGKGQTVTAIIQGKNFSPQLGVLINGIPLVKSLSITRVGSSEAPSTFPESGIHGEFELTNSRVLALHFSMGSGFLGTPVITLVAPERTDVINSFPLWINSSKTRKTLTEVIKQEPMFLDSFSIDTRLEEFKRSDLAKLDKCLESCSAPNNFVFYRLNGTGLRPEAEISIADTILEKHTSNFAEFGTECGKSSATLYESTRSYLLCFAKPSGKHWKVRYSASTRQDLDQAKFEHVPAAEAFTSQIRHYRFIPKNAGGPKGDLYLTFSIPVEIQDRPKVCFDHGEGTCDPPQKDQDDNFRVHCTLNADRGEQDFVSFRAVAFLKDTPGGAKTPSCDTPLPTDLKPVQLASLTAAPLADNSKSTESLMTWFVDLHLPVRPRLTEIARVASADRAGADQAVLKGFNLQRVIGVLFGQQEAKVVTSGDPDSMLVEIPAHEVAAGQKEQVPVIFQTEDGAVPTGRTLEFTGPPLPKKEKAAAKS